MNSFRAILLPGSVLPSQLAYGSLVAALGSDAEVLAKELEVYSTEEAPLDYDLDLEVAGVEREADAREWERFHLVGYSGGGAAALAVVAASRTECRASPFWSPLGRVTGIAPQPRCRSGARMTGSRAFLRMSSSVASCG